MKSILLSNRMIHEGNLVLVNKNHPCRDRASSDRMLPVCGTGSTVLLERRTAVLLSKLMEDLGGWRSIAAVSGWRSEREQQQIWDQSMEANGAEFTGKYVALPGCSEHQTGLAIDLGLRKGDIDFICPDFLYTGICQRFREKAPLYGFVERYPKGKEAVTGIFHEPWHFRYVGIPHAAIMTERGMTLEEYLPFIRQYPFGSSGYEYRGNNLFIRVSYLGAVSGESTCLEIGAGAPYAVSGNNVDGFIITEWREGYGSQKTLRWA